MLNDAQAGNLESYRIGPKVRALRTSKNLGLANLGLHTGLSAGMLSKIETGQVFPTLPTLLRIAMVFGVGLEHFFEDSDRPVLEIMRAQDRIRLPDRTDKMPSYFYEALDANVSERPMSSFLSDFMPRVEASNPHSHDGLEYMFIIEGQVGVEIHGNRKSLGAGDSMIFDASFSHSYICESPARARALIVVSGSHNL